MAKAAGLIDVIAINDSIYPCWFAGYGYCCDKRFWQHHLGIPGFKGIKVSCDDSGLPDVRWLRNTGTQGFDPIPGNVRSGGNSGYQAMHLAMQLGAAKIILVAFDMTGKAQQHWFGEHPDEIRCTALSQDGRIREFAALKPELEKRGIDVVNTSPSTALTFFRRVTLDAALTEVEKTMRKHQEIAAAPEPKTAPAPKGAKTAEHRGRGHPGNIPGAQRSDVGPGVMKTR